MSRHITARQGFCFLILRSTHGLAFSSFHSLFAYVELHATLIDCKPFGINSNNCFNKDFVKNKLWSTLQMYQYVRNKMKTIIITGSVVLQRKCVHLYTKSSFMLTDDPEISQNVDGLCKILV